jgi:hypothetical protein
LAQIALTAGSTASMRAMQASSSSTGEISLMPISRRSSTAESEVSAASVMVGLRRSG